MTIVLSNSENFRKNLFFDCKVQALNSWPGSHYNGNSVMVRGEQWDRWVVFSRLMLYNTWRHYIVAWMIHTEIQKWITRIIELDCLLKVHHILPGWPFLLCFDQLCSELSRKGCFCKSKIWLSAHHSTSFLRFLEQVSNLSQEFPWDGWLLFIYGGCLPCVYLASFNPA